MKVNNVINTTLLVMGFYCLSIGQTKMSVFKQAQLKNSRVKDAYDAKWGMLQSEIKKIKINPDSYDIYLRAFKMEGILEVWMKNENEPKYQLLKTYNICAKSGSLGPKRQEGDGQVPEGYYQIVLFNNKSNYHLSMKINYPNASDVLLKEGSSPGGDIMIHGDCVTIGCLPMTDDKIKELYVLCLEAKNRNKILYIDIYPAKFNEENLKMLEANYPKTKIAFWNTLKPGYDYFEEHRWLPRVSVDKKGKYFYAE